LAEYPTLRVFAGLKAGDLIWKMADRNVRFHGALMDYCGMPGVLGKKNMPADDMDNLLRYNLLADQAVLTQTVCARSHRKVTRKFEGFQHLVETIKKCALRDGRLLRQAQGLTYTDPGSQTMCHFRCILSR
jgi:DNA-binding GntR family transcriptional regulator